MRLIERTGEASVRTKLQQIIDLETAEAITMPELVARLKELGIDAKVSITRTGKIRGISYQLEGVATSGTHLGKAYTFGGLQKHRQVRYDQNLHREELIKASQRLALTPRGARSPVSIKTVEEKKPETSQQVELALTQQRERSLIIAPILRDYINEVKLAEVKTKDYRVFWRKEEQTLYLYKKEEAEPRLKIKYQNQKFEPIEQTSTSENQPRLTNADVEYWQQLAIRLHQVQQQRKRQRQEQQKIKRGRSR